jgi:uncharacterized protein (DUF697 family)
MASDFWKLVFGDSIAESASDDTLAAALQAARKKVPAPVVWLLGKAQSGKTSIIRGLTSATDAEIGNGFRPCTRTARLYPYPDAEKPLVQFLDTRGLGEAAYDPTEDMAVAATQSHVLLVVVKACDHALNPLTGPLATIRRAHPRWPVIVAQTTLHEAYPTQAMQHVEPYPFAADILPATVPAQVARTLAVQRDTFKGIADHFVPLDFTLPVDGFVEPLYGLDQLWKAIDDAVPQGLRAILADDPDGNRVLADDRLRAAHRLITWYALAAGGAGAVPVPIVDLPMLLGIQLAMLRGVASVYGQTLTLRLMAELTTSLGLGVLMRQAGRELLKFVPVAGAGAAAVYAAGTTYALGRTLAFYFQNVHEGHVPDAAALRRFYDASLALGTRRAQATFTPPASRDEGPP